MTRSIMNRSPLPVPSSTRAPSQPPTPCFGSKSTGGGSGSGGGGGGGDGGGFGCSRLVSNISPPPFVVASGADLLPHHEVKSGCCDVGRTNSIGSRKHSCPRNTATQHPTKLESVKSQSVKSQSSDSRGRATSRDNSRMTEIAQPTTTSQRPTRLHRSRTNILSRSSMSSRGTGCSGSGGVRNTSLQPCSGGGREMRLKEKVPGRQNNKEEPEKLATNCLRRAKTADMSNLSFRSGSWSQSTMKVGGASIARDYTGGGEERQYQHRKSAPSQPVAADLLRLTSAQHPSSEERISPLLPRTLKASDRSSSDPPPRHQTTRKTSILYPSPLDVSKVPEICDTQALMEKSRIVETAASSRSTASSPLRRFVSAPVDVAMKSSKEPRSRQSLQSSSSADSSGDAVCSRPPFDDHHRHQGPQDHQVGRGGGGGGGYHRRRSESPLVLTLDAGGGPYYDRDRDIGHVNHSMRSSAQEPYPPMPMKTRTNSRHPVSSGSRDVCGRDNDSKKITLEISPGVFAPLRGSQETLNALELGHVAAASCMACAASLWCIYDAELVLCPDCSVVSPVVDTRLGNVGVGRDGSNRRGVGLGVYREPASG